MNFERCVNTYFAQNDIICGRCHRRIGNIETSNDIGTYVRLTDVRMMEQKPMEFGYFNESTRISVRQVEMNNNLKRKSSFDECPLPEKRIKYNNSDPIVLMRVFVPINDLHDDILLMDFDADEVFQEIDLFEGSFELEDIMMGHNPMLFNSEGSVAEFYEGAVELNHGSYTPSG